MSISGNLLKFNEKKHSCFYGDYRVYIFGVDVTEYVTQNLEWTLADRNGDSTAAFTLQNAKDNFVVTADNLGISPTTYKKIKEPFFRVPAKNSPSVTLGGEYLYSELPKKQIIAKKQEFNKKVTDTNKQNAIYPLGFRCNCLHKNDTVRIFIQNPISLTEWYCVFTGYLDQIQKTKDFISGQSTLSITCYDVRALMKRMRVQRSPFQGQWQVEEPLNNPQGFFADFVKTTKYNHPLADMPFEDAMDRMILGDPKGGEYGVGVGLYSKGDLYYYNSENKTGYVQRIDSSSSNVYGTKGKTENGSSQEILRDWYNLCVMGKREDGTIRPLTLNEVKKMGEGSYPSGPYAPDQQKMYKLLPDGSVKAAHLTQRTFSDGVEQRDFDDRWNIVTSFSETIDYQWWVTGIGDIVFEFAMYEFLPNDFGYGNILTVDDYIISDDVSDESGDVPTVLTITGGMYNNDIGKEVDVNYKQLTPRVVIVNPALCARLGIKNEEHPIPVVINKQSLAILGHIEFFKRLAMSNSMTMTFSFRPWLLPNKPVWHKSEERIGVTSGVTNRYELFSSMSTNATLRYIRRRNLNNEFVFIDGAPSVVASYQKAWANQEGTSYENVGALTITVDSAGNSQTATSTEKAAF